MTTLPTQKITQTLTFLPGRTSLKSGKNHNEPVLISWMFLWCARLTKRHITQNTPGGASSRKAIRFGLIFVLWKWRPKITKLMIIFINWMQHIVSFKKDCQRDLNLFSHVAQPCQGGAPLPLLLGNPRFLDHGRGSWFFLAQSTNVLGSCQRDFNLFSSCWSTLSGWTTTTSSWF